MKYKIRKFNYGGAVFTPIVESIPTLGNANTVDTNSNIENSKNSKESILDDEIMDNLYKVTGLTNDVNEFISELISLESLDEFSYTNPNNRAKALHIIAKSNELKNSKEYWKDAIARAKESGGLGEVAVDANGYVYGKTKDNRVIAVAPTDYQTLSKKMNLLSVQELMYERQNNPTLSGQNQLFTVADNAIGINKITQQISDLISAFGTETTEQSNVFAKKEAEKAFMQMTGKEPSEQDIKSMQLLNSVINSPSNYSKVKIKNSTERAHFDKAVKYLWQSLGTPAQNKLMAVAKLNGEKSPENFIVQMLMQNTDESRSVETTPIKDDVALGKSSDGENDNKKVAITYPELFHNDRMRIPGKMYTLNNPNAGVEINMQASAVGSLPSLTKSGEIIEAGVISYLLSKGNYKSIVNPQEAYLGDDKVDPSMLGELAYTGSDAAKVYAPIKADGSIDLGSMEKFSQLYEVFKENMDIWTPAQAESYFSNNDFHGVKVNKIINEQGKPVLSIVSNQKVKPFLALPVITNSASQLSDSPWMVKMVGEDADAAETLMEQAFTIYGGTASKPTSKDVSPSSWLSLEKPYMGTLFIAYRPEAPAVISSMFGHMIGDAANESDLRRNLQNSSNNAFSKTNANSDLLRNGY